MVLAPFVFVTCSETTGAAARRARSLHFQNDQLNLAARKNISFVIFFSLDPPSIPPLGYPCLVILYPQKSPEARSQDIGKTRRHNVNASSAIAGWGKAELKRTSPHEPLWLVHKRAVVRHSRSIG